MARPASAVRRRCCRREPAASASCHDPPELSCARLSQHPSSHSTPLYNTAVPLRGSDAPPQRTHVSLFPSRCGTKPFPHITFLHVSCREQAALWASCCDTPEPSSHTRHPSPHSLSLESIIVQLRGVAAPPQTYTRPLPSRAGTNPYPLIALLSVPWTILLMALLWGATVARSHRSDHTT
jgi:hypothetical protein